MKKLETSWGYGIFIGVKRTSGEVIIATDDKKVKVARTIRRVPEPERWVVENLEWIQHVPWNLGKEDKEADGDATNFDFKSGPGSRMSEDEVEKIVGTKAVGLMVPTPS